jgi:hypothetical protein
MITLHYTTLHSLDPELVKVTVGSGICCKYKNICTVQLKFSHKKIQENTVVTHKAIQKSTYVQQYCELMLFTQHLNQ